VEDCEHTEPPARDNGEPNPRANRFEPGTSREPEKGIDVEKALSESFAFDGFAVDPGLPAIAQSRFAFLGGAILPNARKDMAGNDDEQPSNGVNNGNGRPEMGRL